MFVFHFKKGHLPVHKRNWLLLMQQRKSQKVSWIVDIKKKKPRLDINIQLHVHGVSSQSSLMTASSEKGWACSKASQESSRSHQGNNKRYHQSWCLRWTHLTVNLRTSPQPPLLFSGFLDWLAWWDSTGSLDRQLCKLSGWSSRHLFEETA
jgi:hypothetical protein